MRTSSVYLRILVTILGLAMLPSAVSGALVDSTTGNTSNPPDDPGWNHVGGVNGSTGVYLGNRWVLTASHVGPGNITLPSGTFNFQAGTDVRLMNTAAGLSTFTDLVLYRLTTSPGLPNLSISNVTVPVGGNVTLIGRGKDRATNLTHWDVTMSGDDWIWTETAPSGTNTGYKTLSTNSMRWGSNLIEDDESFFGDGDADHSVIVDSGFGDVVSIITEFDKVGETAGAVTNDESQAVRNDSGGGVFYKNGLDWELTGIMHAVQGLHDQPDPGTHAIFGDLTLAADLSTYRNQINSITAIPESSSFFLTGISFLGFGLGFWLKHKHRS